MSLGIHTELFMVKGHNICNLLSKVQDVGPQVCGYVFLYLFGNLSKGSMRNLTTCL